MRKRLTQKEKDKLLSLCAEGMPFAKIAQQIRCNPSAVYYHCSPKAREAAHRKSTSPQAHARSRRYYEQHHDKIREQQKKRYEEKKKEIAEYHREYYKKNKERITAQHKRWNEENAERVKQWREEHREELRKYAHDYYQAHRTEKDVQAREYKARKRGETTGDLEKIKEIYRQAAEAPRVRCYICGKLIPKGHRHVDHIIPLSRGGKHCPSNLAIACDKCNLKKGKRRPEEIGMLF